MIIHLLIQEIPVYTYAACNHLLAEYQLAEEIVIGVTFGDFPIVHITLNSLVLTRPLIAVTRLGDETPFSHETCLGIISLLHMFCDR